METSERMEWGNFDGLSEEAANCLRAILIDDDAIRRYLLTDTVVALAVERYLDELTHARPLPRMCGGESVLAPRKRPESLAEAGEIAKLYLT